MSKKRFDSENLSAGRITAKYNMLSLMIFPIVAIMKFFDLVSFDWWVFAAATIVAVISVIASIIAIGSSAKILCTFSAIISTTLLLLLHRDGLLILFLPILVAMLFDDLVAIRLSFVYAMFAFLLVEGLNYYYLKDNSYNGIIVAGIAIFFQLIILLNFGANLIDRVKRKFNQEKALIDNINDLVKNAKSLADDIGINSITDDETSEIEEANMYVEEANMDREESILKNKKLNSGTEENLKNKKVNSKNEKHNNVIEKVRIETGKVLKYNQVIGEISGDKEKKKTIVEDMSLLLNLSEKAINSFRELNSDIDKLSSSIEGIGDIIEDTKEMSAAASIQEIALKKKNPKLSNMARDIGNMAYGAKSAAERLILDFKEIQSDGMNAVKTLELTYETVYRNLELINRNVDILLRWVALKEDVDIERGNKYGK